MKQLTQNRNTDLNKADNDGLAPIHVASDDYVRAHLEDLGVSAASRVGISHAALLGVLWLFFVRQLL